MRTRGPPRGFWPLWAAAAATILRAGGVAGGAHSLRYFFTGASEAGAGLPRFLIVGYLDEQPFVRYDSHSRRDEPRNAWIRRAESHDPHYWRWQSRLSRRWELFFRDSLWGRHNRSRGLHTWQWMHGCELTEEGHKRGYSQFGYDGKDYLSLDKETLTWTATDARAQVTKRRWDADRVWTEGRKNFVEERCMEWLHKYLDYGKETLLRREPPTVTVGRKADFDGLETLICRAHGFYPKEIVAVWKKDGEVWEQDTFHGGVAPNWDGTYHTWVSIKIDPTDRARYRCHVAHDGLLEPGEWAWEEPASLWPVVGGILGAAATVLFVAGIFFCIKKRENESKAATPARNQRTDSPTMGHAHLLAPLEGGR